MTSQTQSNEDKIKEQARIRLRDDFEFYCAKAMAIRTKEGDIKNLVLNKAQKYLLKAIEHDLRTKGFVRIVILKGRQQGLSTVVGARLYHQVTHRRGAKALVMAHKADSSTALFTMTKRYHDKCPEILKPSTKYSSKRELTFDRLDSAFMVATAGGDGIARGETLTHMHASEMAFWAKTSAKEVWNGLAQAVPKSPGTEVYVESTANGMSGLFFDLYQKAKNKENDYTAVFIPWHWQDEYSVQPPAGFEIIPEEQELKDKFGLTDGQLYWRRLKIGETSHDQFKQEYPMDDKEAFLTSGLPAFDLERVSDDLDKARSLDTRPLRYGLIGDEWEKNERGHLIVYEDFSPTKTYAIGADVSKGIKGGDWSVAVIMDNKSNVVAKYRSHVLPDRFATVLASLGEWYGNALLLVEANDHGVLTNFVLSRDLNYPNLYTATQHDKLDDKDTPVLGFVTNAKTRPLILDGLRSKYRKGTLSVPDVEILQEMQTFIANDNGKLVAEEGSHDDCVMALAIANYGSDELWDPVIVTSDMYFENI